MKNYFQSHHNQRLQNAYGAWALTIPVAQIIAICLSDPKHAMAAFFGISSIGRQVCIASPEIIKNLDSRFTSLKEKQNPNDNAIIAGEVTNFITFSSGTTCAPKAILRSPKSWIFSFGKTGVKLTDSVAILGHLSHSLALYAACEAMQIGAQMNYCGMRPCGTPTVIYATPTLLKLVYKNNKVYLQVRLIFIGGGHFSAADKSFCDERFPNADVRIFYGTAETSFITISDRKTPNGSVGRAFNGVKIQTKNEVISVETPMLAIKCMNSTKIFGDNTPFATGELGWIDKNGFVYIHGRSDRAVKIADKMIHLDVLENDLMSIKGIKNAGVITLPDIKRGQRAFGAVIGNDAKHPQISNILQLTKWPQLLSGKTDYLKLKEILAKAFL
jgi:long-chain acyl-CoA synthetase